MLRFPTRTRQGQRGPLVVLEKFLFFPFFQHFLQQYRRHRIHSFTNTKHTTTTTTLVAVAVKKGQRSKLQDVEGYPVTALTIFILQGFKKTTKKTQLKTSGPAHPPYGYLFWDEFCSNITESKVLFQTRR